MVTLTFEACVAAETGTVPLVAGRAVGTAVVRSAGVGSGSVVLLLVALLAVGVTGAAVVGEWEIVGGAGMSVTTEQVSLEQLPTVMF